MAHGSCFRIQKVQLEFIKDDILGWPYRQQITWKWRISRHCVALFFCLLPLGVWNPSNALNDQHAPPPVSRRIPTKSRLSCKRINSMLYGLGHKLWFVRQKDKYNKNQLLKLQNVAFVCTYWHSNNVWYQKRLIDAVVIDVLVIVKFVQIAMQCLNLPMNRLKYNPRPRIKKMNWT